VPTTGGKLVQQPESAVFALTMGFAVIPALLFMVNGIFLWLYDLNEGKLTQVKP
jgi:GPH family glycoside/pentoside/hexuronide:cation symporter